MQNRDGGIESGAIDFAQAQRVIEAVAKGDEGIDRIIRWMLHPLLEGGPIRADFWKKSQSRKLAPEPTMPGRVLGIKVVDVRRARTAEILATAGLLNEALNLIIARHELTPFDWENAFQSVASQYPTSPPSRLLLLPKEERRRALQGWTEGLVPFIYEGEQNYSDTLDLFTPIS